MAIRGLRGALPDPSRAGDSAGGGSGHYSGREAATSVRRILLALAISALIPALVGFTWPGTVEWLCTRGIEYYHAGEFTEAQESFDRALEHSPQSHRLQFNRGDALYRQERYEEAAETFELAGKSSDVELAPDAAYNLGNTHFKSGDMQAAISAYKQALTLDPDDGEAKHNLELALRKQQEQQKQQQQQDKEEQEQDQDPEEDQQQDEQQEQEQDEQEQGDQQDQAPDPQQQQQAGGDQHQGDDQDDGQQPQPGQQDEGELTEDQARRLLHALASQDAEMQKLIRRVPQRRQPSEGEKDW
ncbi:MAG: tetratricopeptide repeat protein [Armatimonadia bacterium]|nr:tetratricopeptide repeat protein [Armatimonadia bacterium]